MKVNEYFAIALSDLVLFNHFYIFGHLKMIKYVIFTCLVQPGECLVVTFLLPNPSHLKLMTNKIGSLDFLTAPYSSFRGFFRVPWDSLVFLMVT